MSPVFNVVFRPDFLPNWMIRDTVFMNLTAWQWILMASIVVGAFIVSPILQVILVAISRKVTSRTKTSWDEKIIDQLPGPARILIAILLIRLCLPLVGLQDTPMDDKNSQVDNVEHILEIGFIIAATWLVLRLVGVAAVIAEEVLTRDITEENRIRSIHTWIAIPRRIIRFVLVVVAVALVCLQFEVVRSVGVSLLASAGLASVIIGLSAQKSLANILAGIQLAFAQPVKIGDTVVVEGEFGTVEEINLTNVIVKIWDERRLILPVSYFLEKPFTNWTYHSRQLLGTVFLYTDYTVPLDEIRELFKEVLENHSAWDKRASGVLVTDLTNDTVQVRLMMSAKNSSDVWTLRCHVREKILEWLQGEGRAYLPETRVEMLAKDN